MIKTLENLVKEDVSNLSNDELVKAGAMIKELKNRTIKTLENRKNDWTDFTCFVLNCIEEENDMGFATAKSYLDGSCFDEAKIVGIEENVAGITYAIDEDSIWNELFKVTGVKKDYYDLEKQFVSCKWMDNYNTAIIKLSNAKEFAILRM